MLSLHEQLEPFVPSPLDRIIILKDSQGLIVTGHNHMKMRNCWESNNSDTDTEDYQPYEWDLPDCALYCSSCDWCQWHVYLYLWGGFI